MVQSVCWHLGFETDILKCNVCRKKTVLYHFECIYFSNVEAVETKHNTGRERLI